MSRGGRRSTDGQGGGRHRGRSGRAGGRVSEPTGTGAKPGSHRSRWVIVVALLCALGLVAPGLLFATGTNSATTTAPTTTAATMTAPTTPGSTPSTPAPHGPECSTISEGAPVPADFTSCVGADGAGEPSTFLGCPDGANVVSTVGYVGRPGGTWKRAPAGATNEQLTALGC